MMQAARLKQVNLEIDTSGAIEESKNAAPTDPFYTPSNRNAQMNVLVGEPNYREKLSMFLEVEKLKLITQAVAQGISEATVLEVMQDQSLIDFNLEHLKEIIDARAARIAEGQE